MRWSAAIALVLSVSACGATTPATLSGVPSTEPEPAAEAPVPDELLPEERTAAAIFRRASPAVVHITRLSVRTDLFTRNAMAVPDGTGSGVVWDDQGHIVTNFHVIQGADAAHVTFDDGSTLPARLIGYYGAKDIAVLRVDAPADALSPLPLGRSSDLVVGQHAYAIGNPFGLDHTLSTGVVSGLGREILSATRRPIQDVIQTDAAINPGNSGGPLLDSHGRLIGINTAIYSPTGTSAGIGFAVPIDAVRRVVSQLIEHGRVVHAGLGIRVDESGFSRRLGVRGAMIVGIAPGSEAEAAGLQPAKRDLRTGRIQLGDVIVGIDGEAVETPVDLYRVLDGRAVGDTAVLRVVRGNGLLEVELTLRAETDE